LEKTITKDILKNELFSGGQPAAELLYNRYGGMLFSYVQQFVPNRTEAESLLVNILPVCHAGWRLPLNRVLSVYCWLQIEARKIILEHREQRENDGWLGKFASGGEQDVIIFPYWRKLLPSTGGFLWNCS